MDAFTLTIDNLRGLRHVRWSPRGLCLLVGANGAGKSTLLLALKLLRVALDRGLPEATTLVLGGSQGLKHLEAADDEAVRLGVELGALRWQLSLRPRGPTVDYLAEEALYDGDQLIYQRDGLGGFAVLGERWVTDERLGLRAVLDAQRGIPQVDVLAAFLRGIAVYHDADLYGLRSVGSNTSQTKALHSRGSNALTMLRLWQQQRPDRHRYQLVLDGLAAAFPGLIADLDFQEAGSTLVARVYRPGSEAPTPLSNEANGLIALLIDLCCLAAAEPGAVVALDEVGNALHPYATRVLARLAAQLARQRGLTLIFATHNTVLIDQLSDRPEDVFVLQANVWPGPTALTALRSRQWLEQFRLGELYADGELGSNAVER
jgi:predicted ATPase